MRKLHLDWNKYIDISRQTVAEGCVLLENKNNTLPLKKNSVVSLFGRIQTHYYKSGTGSGGLVNVSSVTGIIEGLKESGHVTLNEYLLNVYRTWEETHPFDEGVGWGSEPWSQEEMPLSDEMVSDASKASDIAIVIIGRTAGEDMDSSDIKGAYRLSDLEEDMLAKVRQHFDSMVVLMNIGGIMDFSFIDQYNPDAVLIGWQGGMVGGSGTADILTGVTSPSGKLTDTIAYKISDYPSTPYFGDENKNYYCEDIYVGYRYFETFAKEAVRYPFGYGLSYTSFKIDTTSVLCSPDTNTATVHISVKNIGTLSGKEVVQIYTCAPQGLLGKPKKVLTSFAKSKTLAPGETELLSISFPYSRLASYDDSGVTGHKSCYLLEEGTYIIYMGTNIDNANEIATFSIPELTITEELHEALAPVESFQRFHASKASDNDITLQMEDVPLSTIDMDQRRKNHIPPEINYTGPRGYSLSQVKEGSVSINDFVAQLSDEDLSCIIRGEGMGSALVTPGTASAFGGVSKALTALGIPAICCDDGPSGMRLDCGTKAFSIPNGTMIGCTFNPSLIENLFTYLGMEMITQNVDSILGPGMNIHRHPLNGRNFEYFSEDPYLTGIMAISELRGLHRVGVTGTIKHFCGNNQEKRRRFTDSVISERALREIYLKGFEIAVKSGYADSVMTTYGAVNGLWTAGSYDLNTTILRNEWGFKGIVMTDWWAEINERNKPQNRTNFAAMARAQNDLYMVCPDGSRNATGDNTLDSLIKGTLTRGELQRNAINICNFALNTQALARLTKTETQVEVLNKPVDENDFDSKDVQFIQVEDKITLPLNEKESKANTNYILPLDIETPGKYRIYLTGSSTLSELAQIPCTLFRSGTPILNWTFNGTNGENVTFKNDLLVYSRFNVMRLFVARNGLQLKDIRIEYVEELDPDA